MSPDNPQVTSAPGPSFRTAGGLLTPYALACGYIQRATDTGNYLTAATCLDLWREGACYHVRAHNFAEGRTLFWDSFDKLSDARRRFSAARKAHELRAHP